MADDGVDGMFGTTGTEPGTWYIQFSINRSLRVNSGQWVGLNGEKRALLCILFNILVGRENKNVNTVQY